MSAAQKEQTDFGEDGNGVHRLLGMVVGEVSLVDRAANKRKFLVVKRDGMATTVQKDQTAAAPAMPGGDNQPAPAKLPAMQAQVKDSLTAALTAACEKLVSLAQSIKEADVTDQQADPAVPSSVTGEIGEIASMLAGISSQYGGTAAAPEGKAATPTKGGDLAGITENGGADQQGEQKRDAAAVTKAHALFTQVFAKGGPGKPITLKADDALVLYKGLEVVSKAGRKMAKERLDRFRKAMDMLAGILKELASDKVRKAAQPTGLAAFVKLPATEAAELAEGLEALTKAVTERDAKIVQLSEQVTQLRKAAPPSNALTPEGNRPAPRDVQWPVDMNHDPNPKKPHNRFGVTGR